MFNRDQSDDYQPLFWFSGHPVYVNTLLVALHIIGFAVVAIMMSFFGDAVTDVLSLGSFQVLHYGQVWRLVSYVLFPPGTAIAFIFLMLFLIYFGRQVEIFVGRKTYMTLYAALVLIPAVLVCLLSLIGLDKPYLSGFGSIFGVFIAFATLYPRLDLSFWFVSMTASMWAYALLAVWTLVDIAYHDWVGLATLWCDAAVGYFGMRLIGAGYGFTWLTDWLDERRARRLAQKHNIKVLKDTQASESIDQILEKISKHGVSSLSAKERAALERARTKLLKRDER